MDSFTKSGKCIIFSAPSGAGKTTIVHALLDANIGLEFSVSACSRSPRPNEVNGRDYYFLDVETFKKQIANGDFLEWQEVYTNNFYGTLRSEITRIWNQNKTVVFDVDVIGGLNLKRIFGEHALAIFVQPPTIEILEDRLRNRSTESEEKIIQRMHKAKKELVEAPKFDCIIFNDSLENAIAKSKELVLNFIKS